MTPSETPPTPSDPPPRAPSKLWRGLGLVGAILGLAVVVIVLGAHFLRRGHLGGAVAIVLAPLALIWGKAWVARVLSVALLAGALAWLQTTILFVRVRLSIGMPVGRLLAILGMVTLLTALSPLLLRVTSLRSYLAPKPGERVWAPTAAALLTVVILGVVQVMVSPPLMLLERFLPGFGWLEILFAALYAGWATERLLSRDAARWRRRLWTFFSVFFFGQLALGLFVDPHFLMHPHALHFPIPALIFGGPIYRGNHFFMIILFLSTLVLVGPAWCSHLCYLGAWDLNAAAHGSKHPRNLPTWSRWVRVGLLLLLIGVAWLLGYLGASPFIAGSLALAFGLGGVAVMLLISRRRGTMAHCVVYCPIGLVANILGKLSPFRMRIADGCTLCNRCTAVCRYDALGPKRLAEKKVGFNCTLCGDCVPVCPTGDMQMTFLGMTFLGMTFLGTSPAVARAIFIVLVVALQASTLCLARI